ncbi:low choriolytic enzyme isoform X2 [Hydra vulgaris]|uniref:Metalloendopeptidase n=1 Tax=Hydra vulgaris TaxID=6087 RepID=A0ABM4BGM0_HYDVU
MMKFLVLLLCFVSHVALSWVPEMENKNLFEGDMVLTPDDINSNGYASIVGGRWPNNIVPYDLSRMSSSNHIHVLRAIDEYHKHTCLKFVKRTNQDAYLSFYPGGGCSSLVGYVRGRINDVSLAGGCLRLGTVLHEIGHSIGLYHEQSRPDRDDHVTIVWNNIQSDMRFNFDKFDRNRINSLGFPYDYESMMHYDQTAFGSGRVTIRTKDPSKQNLIGNRQGFSEIDKQQINAMYNCNRGGSTLPPSGPPTVSPVAQCVEGQDLDNKCLGWATSGYCTAIDPAHLETMKKKCCKSCKESAICNDKNTRCDEWARKGECKANPNWMLGNCSKSCLVCK